MKARKKDQKNLMKVGLFVAGLISILMIMIVSIGKENSLFESKVDILARVNNVSNLKPGSYVELKGIRIGSVRNIEIISHNEVEIRMTILEKELKWINEDSKVSISTAGLVGDKFVEIHSGSESASGFNPEKDILRSESSVGINEIMEKGSSIAGVTDQILTKLNAILSSLGDGKVLTEMVSSLNKSSANMEKITHELKDARLGQMAKNVNQSTASLERILTRVEKGPGTLNSLIYTDDVHEDLRVLLGGAQRNKVIKYFIRESIKKAEDRN